MLRWCELNSPRLDSGSSTCCTGWYIVVLCRLLPLVRCSKEVTSFAFGFALIATRGRQSSVCLDQCVGQPTGTLILREHPVHVGHLTLFISRLMTRMLKLNSSHLRNTWCIVVCSAPSQSLLSITQRSGGMVPSVGCHSFENVEQLAGSLLLSESENIGISTSFVGSTSDVLEDENSSNPEAEAWFGDEALGAPSAVPVEAASDVEIAQRRKVSRGTLDALEAQVAELDRAGQAKTTRLVRTVAELDEAREKQAQLEKRAEELVTLAAGDDASARAQNNERHAGGNADPQGGD
ncbi:hypothetical protein MRX96_029919 [Rhipicephalus microplus]